MNRFLRPMQARFAPFFQKAFFAVRVWGLLFWDEPRLKGRDAPFSFPVSNGIQRGCIPSQAHCSLQATGGAPRRISESAVRWLGC